MSGNVVALDGSRTVPDEALIDAVQRGDDRVASALYGRLVDAVDRTLYRVLGQYGPDHDDLVQQAFEQIISTLARNSFARQCSLRTWAARVATNVGLNALRSRRRERSVIDRHRDLGSDATAEAGRDPEPRLDSRAELACVRRALSEMKPAHVEILILHDVLGHDLAEISMILGLSGPAAQSRLFRGRRVLRRELERIGVEPRGARAP